MTTATSTNPERQAGLRLQDVAEENRSSHRGLPRSPVVQASLVSTSTTFSPVECVLAGWIIAACEELGVPVELIFGLSPEMRVPALAGNQGTRDDHRCRI